MKKHLPDYPVTLPDVILSNQLEFKIRVDDETFQKLLKIIERLSIP